MSFHRDFNDKIAFEAWNARRLPAYKTIAVTPISPTLGAEIRGVDLSKEVPADQLAEIDRAFAEHLVLAFRGQEIGAEDQKRFGRHFGLLHRHVLAKSKALSSMGEDPEILAWHTDKESRNTAGDAWHHDVSCDTNPIWVSLLRLLKLPEGGGGDTVFANQYLAYESLSDRLKTFLDGLTAIHDGASAWTAGYGAQPEPGKTFPSAEHPVIARHPVTGRKFLFVNAAFTTRIPQLTRAESDAVLELLFRHIERNPSLQTRVHWSADTLLIWDNWATQHHAVWDYYPFERWGERVSVYRDHGPQA